MLSRYLQVKPFFLSFLECNLVYLILFFLLMQTLNHSFKEKGLYNQTLWNHLETLFGTFIGSPWVVLSKSFVEDSIRGTDNLPRKLLMYFTNVVYATEAYFQTLSCNSLDFMNKTINADLRFFVWDNPPGLDPLFISKSNYDKMISSRAAFARRFQENEPVLDQLDKDILKRISGNFTYGKWQEHGDINIVESGPMGLNLKQLISEVIGRTRCV